MAVSGKYRIGDERPFPCFGNAHEAETGRHTSHFDRRPAFSRGGNRHCPSCAPSLLDGRARYHGSGRTRRPSGPFRGSGRRSVILPAGLRQPGPIQAERIAELGEHNVGRARGSRRLTAIPQSGPSGGPSRSHYLLRDFHSRHRSDIGQPLSERCDFHQCSPISPPQIRPGATRFYQQG